MRRFVRFDDFSEGRLWELRKQIVVNSMFTAHYINDMHISPYSAGAFFDGYYDYLWELAEEKWGKNATEEKMWKLDCKKNLWGWYKCYDDLSWVEYTYHNGC